ncbi:hypothetical protein BU26DRAFT_513474 [Trematosphaeria pertusa]|uniref:Altered inheritance of mitochondria protein 19 n=1 Tax=Trematosphaeria pertusa TaxID=390896 RepID=A0A6A6J5C2_9PLEO|nr:uncharacterized protein BU26DRAFT_513474 [Trematosphaeria pertusa]KAF2256673.1 hypothetical protein BU26DRAFT_513474 [Trematosphaeria pertusa]
MADTKAKEGLLQSLRNWGEHSVPPTLLATLITAQHMRPFQPLPMMFPPVLLFSSYLNLSGYKTDAAGTTAAWSGLYALLAMRRKQQFTQKFTIRGFVRGASLALCAVNVAGCGLAYVFGRREKEDRKE